MQTTRLLLSGNNAEEIRLGLTDVLKCVSPWFRYNCLSLNCAKTQFLIYGTRQVCSTVNFDHIDGDGNTISKASKVKYLGIKLGPLLNFDEHVNYI